ncbi:hypothetical protein CPC16_009586 [Podila verticillata]|nr:hypothetical protein BGZ52_000619 [Haplosporangium bisporale]KAF9210724.1 hypothetical protein BGZ59_009059 [Podila verticillata]KAF9381984.1 hypothetical protein CPC16_009586 [Podila verticillata]KFH68162.1 hypothetical protein MVEG_06891 [Podila verticillata NRRL 6337]
MSKILVVFGATGLQGGSVASYVLQDAQLSKEYKVRAVTRDPSQPAAQDLKNKGAEVVKGDMTDRDSIKHAVQGAHTVFGVNLVYDNEVRSKEVTQGKVMADEAVAAGAQYFIFSTSQNTGKISGGKYTGIDHFEAKAEVEEYIRTLPIKSAFFAPGGYMENFASLLAPRPVGDGTYTISNIVSPQTKQPLIAVASDSGKYVGAILAEPDKYEGKIFYAATSVTSFEEIAETLSKATGKTIKYNQVPEEVFRGMLPPSIATRYMKMFLFFQDFGYYGPQTEELVAWTSKNVRGKLTTLEEFLAENPLKL